MEYVKAYCKLRWLTSKGRISLLIKINRSADRVPVLCVLNIGITLVVVHFAHMQPTSSDWIYLHRNLFKCAKVPKIKMVKGK